MARIDVTAKGPKAERGVFAEALAEKGWAPLGDGVLAHLDSETKGLWLFVPATTVTTTTTKGRDGNTVETKLLARIGGAGTFGKAARYHTGTKLGTLAIKGTVKLDEAPARDEATSAAKPVDW